MRSKIKKAMLMCIKVNSPIKRKDLLLFAQMSDIEPISDRKMRHLIAELIEEGEPIMSSEKGYALIKNEADLADAISYLKLKSKAISIRANLLLRNWNRQHQSNPVNHQISLEL